MPLPESNPRIRPGRIRPTRPPPPGGPPRDPSLWPVTSLKARHCHCHRCVLIGHPDPGVGYGLDLSRDQALLMLMPEGSIRGQTSHRADTTTPAPSGSGVAPGWSACLFQRLGSAKRPEFVYNPQCGSRPPFSRLGRAVLAAWTVGLANGCRCRRTSARPIVDANPTGFAGVNRVAILGIRPHHTIPVRPRLRSEIGRVVTTQAG